MGQRGSSKKETQRPPQAYGMTPDEKFGKPEHVLKSKDFRKIYNKGFSRKVDAVILYCLPNDLEHGRLGFSISSRSVKQAAKRNRIRRVLREIYRRTKKDLKKSYDLVLVVRSDFGGRISYKKLESIFLKLVGSARILS